jgi:hypothetical protein
MHHPLPKGRFCVIFELAGRNPRSSGCRRRLLCRHTVSLFFNFLLEENMRKMLIAGIFILLFACTNNKQKNILQETNSENNDIVLNETSLENKTIFKNTETVEENVGSSNLPKIMYVNSKEGLRMRSEASVNGNVTGSLLYGERIIVEEKTDTTEIIDNITDFWYRIRGNNISWVFGGYLSENFPSEALNIIGLWEEEENKDIIYYFGSNSIYKKGIKDSEWFRSGKWELNNNVLTLVIDKGAYEKLDNIEIEKANLLVNNVNSIFLNYTDGKQYRLIRSDDVWVYY